MGLQDAGYDRLVFMRLVLVDMVSKPAVDLCLNRFAKFGLRFILGLKFRLLKNDMVVFERLVFIAVFDVVFWHLDICLCASERVHGKHRRTNCPSGRAGPYG